METTKKERRKLAKSLEAARDKRVVLLSKVNKARATFEKRSRKLQDLEARIGELSKQLFEAEGPTESAPAGAPEPAPAAPANGEVKEQQPGPDPAVNE